MLGQVRNLMIPFRILKGLDPFPLYSTVQQHIVMKGIKSQF